MTNYYDKKNDYEIHRSDLIRLTYGKLFFSFLKYNLSDKLFSLILDVYINHNRYIWWYTMVVAYMKINTF